MSNNNNKSINYFGIYNYITKMPEKNFNYILRFTLLIEEYVNSKIIDDEEKYLISLKNNVLHFMNIIKEKNLN